MAENNNQNTVEKQEVEHLNSIPLEPVRDKVELSHYSNTFVNTFAILLRWNGTLYMDQEICLSLVKKDQLCATALMNRK